MYIPLPEDYARSFMFKLHMGDTKNNLGKWAASPKPGGEEDEKIATNPNFIELGKKTKGFSGSDINVVVRIHLFLRSQENAHTHTHGIK